MDMFNIYFFFYISHLFKQLSDLTLSRRRFQGCYKNTYKKEKIVIDINNEKADGRKSCFLKCFLEQNSIRVISNPYWRQQIDRSTKVERQLLLILIFKNELEKKCFSRGFFLKKEKAPNWSCFIVLTRPNPGRREKINLNFYFHTSLWCLKRFYEGLKDLHKTFWGTTKKCENKNLIPFSFLNAQDVKG